MKRVVVTGLGALTPIGSSVAAFLEGLQKGKSGASPITAFDASNFKTRFACQVLDFNPESIIDKREVRRIDRYAQMALGASREALESAGLLTEKDGKKAAIDGINLERVGVIWASGIGGLLTIEQEVEGYATGNGLPRYSPFLIPKMISDIAAGLISMEWGFMGINYATVSACASSSHAIINAFDYIRLGKADIIVAGGSESTVVKSGVGGFNSMKALSERNDDMLTASRPYDKDRDGFVLGEGAAGLILEEYNHAVRRGATILAEVVGSGMTADAHHITAPHPEGLGAANAMKLALKEAKIKPEQVHYLNTHGTSTPLGDVAELRAIQKVFGKKAYAMNISSTKSMTGHLLGAAGAVEALACILAMQNDFVPPTINHFTDDPEIDPKLNLTFNEPQQRKIDYALSNTFGFGGHNTSLILKKI